jgi:uncharacterized phage protein gp47/JayE
MALTFKSPTECADDYLTILKTIRPEVDISKEDSDWWIRSRVHGGVVSGIYADQRKIADDAFPQSARTEALKKHLELYFNRDFNPAQPADGFVLVSGTPGSIVPQLTEFTYVPNGNIYQSTAPVTLSGPTALVPVQSINSGQSQNLLSGASLTLSSPPAGIDGTASATGNIADGKDIESDDEAAAAILNRVQQPPAGGTANDYENYAKEASPSVVNAAVVRYLFGLGTLGIVITSGTSDIDAALDNGDAIVRSPSPALVTEVQDFVDGKKVLTDCVHVIGPEVINIDVTVKVRFLSGDENTIEPNTSLTQGDLVRREVKRAIYKTPPGGRRFGNNGYVVASEIEEVIDNGLSDEPYNTGVYAQILIDRQVEDLSPTGVNLLIASGQLAEPGTINIVSF